MTETTTEQLAEIEGQSESTPATEYTPPEGWRVLAVGERLRDGDLWVNHQGGLWPTKRVGETVNDERYIRRIESQPEPQPEPQPQPEPCAPCDSRDTCDTPATEYTPPEGWRAVRYGELLLPGDVWVNWEGTESRPDILHGDGTTASGGRYIRRIKPEPQAQPQPNAAAIEELRSEVSYVQNLLGTERRRVTQLEELVGSLRTINEAQEKTVRAAGQENTDLQHRLDVVSFEWAQQVQACKQTQEQLEAVKGELVTQAETSRRLRIELDAAQQVPQAIADRFEEGWNQGAARAIETVLEWLESVRLVDNPNLANEVMQHLPQIMRHLTGLAQD